MRLLAVDQAIAETGIALMEMSTEGLKVTDGYTYRTHPRDGGVLEGYFERSTEMGLHLVDRIRQEEPVVVIHEVPVARVDPTRRGAPTGPIAAEAVRMAAAVCATRCEMVQVQAMRKALCGVPGASKSMVRRAVAERVVSADNVRWSSHVADAVALGWWWVEFRMSEQEKSEMESLSG